MTDKNILQNQTLPIWDLSDLYASMDCTALEEDYEKLTTLAAEFAAAFKGKLAGLSADRMLDALQEYEQIEEIIGRINSYAGLLHAGNVVDSEISKFYQSAHENLTAINTKLLFFTLEINRLEDKQIEEWLKQSADLNRYDPWFVTIRQYRRHQLDDALEELLLDKSVTGKSAWVRLFDETMASLKFSYTNPQTGEVESLGTEQALDLLSDAHADKRKAAAESLSQTFGQNIRLFSHITNTLAKDKQVEDRWRNYEDCTTSRHLSNQLEAPVVEALVSAVKTAYPKLSHRYYRLKANWFGKETLPWWDRNAPLPEADDKIYSWGEAKDIVHTAYHQFSPELAEIGQRFFDNDWIDVGLREGKSPGAFAHPTVPCVHPYLLLNYMGKSRDVMTLAHELGHGVHQILAAPQGQLLCDTPLTLAETASVFGEMLTFRSLLATQNDPKKRKLMIAAKVEDMLNTVVRQVAFYDFEVKVHNARKNGELSANDLGDIWMDVQRESLGDAIELDDSYRNYWCYIPHFIHSPFYVYAYAFGDCLVNSLYATYENKPDGFQEKYFHMLRAGGSLRHKELLQPFGLDASDPDFWATGLDMISAFIDQLEE